MQSIDRSITMSLHIRVSLSNPPKAYALLSTDPQKDTAIVFIHGVTGDSVSTWLQFQSLIDSLRSCSHFYSKADLYFYAYDSLRTPLAANAGLCQEFIRSIFPRAQSSLLPTGILSYPPSIAHAMAKFAGSYLPDEYHRLVLVGHSLGGLILRTSIWFAMRDADDPSGGQAAKQLPRVEQDKILMGKDRLLTAQLRLFAPAILGSRLPRLLGIFAPLLWGIPVPGPAILTALGLPFPSIVDLGEGETVLSDVRRYTEESSEEHSTITAFRARVLWGAKDSIVQMWQYKRDHSEYVTGYGHIKICKPTPDYATPLEFVSS